MRSLSARRGRGFGNKFELTFVLLIIATLLALVSYRLWSLGFRVPALVAAAVALPAALLGLPAIATLVQMAVDRFRGR